MASTYSTLKIELMATGENNTTWGTIANTNLQAIEEAIASSADVTFASGDVTVSLTDTNALQSARNLRLRCTGTTGGARNLIVPAIEKPYLIRNDCADTITVKTSAGTGIAVPAGKSMLVYVDGTNVVDGITHLTSLTLASALPVASGGTGVTTSTGTGNVVLSSSPTLVTPALGTPASGVATNLTGLPLTTGVTGTLPVANGGTGVTTSTGTGSVVRASGPTLVGPDLGTPAAGIATNLTGLPLSTGVTGTLPVANGGTGVTTSTGTGNVVLSASPTLSGTLTGAAASFSGTLSATGTFTSTGIGLFKNSEAIRLAHASPIVTFYNAAEATRFGFINHNGTNLLVYNEVASSNIVFNVAAGNVLNLNTTGAQVTGALSATGRTTTAGLDCSNTIVLSGASGYIRGSAGVGSGGLYLNDSGDTKNLCILEDSGIAKFPSISTTAAAANAVLDSGASNSLLRSTSSIKYKTDVETVDPAYNRVLDLRPVWYRSKATNDNPDWGWWGLIAEEVAELDPRLVHYGFQDDQYETVETDSGPERRVKDGEVKRPDGVQYERLAVLLLDVVKREKARNDTLEARIAALEAKLG